MVITYDLRKQIDEKSKKIINSPDYYLRKSQKTKRDLRNICDIHSYWLENPNLRMRILNEIGTEDPRQLRKKSREGIKRINEAWKYLNSEKYDEKKFQYLNPSNILEVGRLIDPSRNMEGFRKLGVTLGFVDYVPPNPFKVPDLIDKFCSDLNESDIHPVEAAALTHLNIAGIQPFIEGNKRTARLFQDTILHQNYLPPAFIPSGERDVYIDLLEQALVGYSRDDFVVQRPFYDYIGGKVNVALDKILGDFEKFHRKRNSDKKIKINH